MPKQKEPAALPANIQHQETLARFGYSPEELSAKSSRKVVFRCQECRELFERKRYLLTPDATCRRCSAILAQKKTLPDVSTLARLDDDETQLRFGYTATSLWCRSSEPVVAHCAKCDTELVKPRNALNRQSYCYSCSHSVMWTQERTAQRMATLRLKYGERLELCNEKRSRTVYARYGEQGLSVFPKKYGASQEEVRNLFASWLGTSVIVSNKPLMCGQHIDIYVPEKKFGLEFNGLRWHHERSPEPRDRLYHLQKLDAAASEGIRLVHLFEDEWRDHRSAVDGVLKSILGIHVVKVGARECTVTELDSSSARTFFLTHHLQGPSATTLQAWGLFHQGQLLGAVSIGRHHRQVAENILVLDRLCFANGVQVMGGASKLLAPLLRYARGFGAKRIISWSDRRWSQGGVYKALGFTCERTYGPDYTYVAIDNPKVRISKQSKKELESKHPPEMSVADWMANQGWARLWDCGKSSWIMEVPCS